jgi:hypothetical protein
MKLYDLKCKRLKGGEKVYGGFYFGTGPSLAGLLSSLLLLAIGILKIVLVVGLIVGIFQIVKAILNNETGTLSINSITANKGVRLALNSFLGIIIISLVLSLVFGFNSGLYVGGGFGH